jgi:hypothetical protein
MSMFWLPKIQQVYNVVPALACNGVTQPYWEQNFVYPTGNSGTPPATTTTTTTKGTTTTTTGKTTATGKTTTKTTTTKSSTKTATPTGGSCTSGSYGLGNGDGNTGVCCKTSDDCVETCRSPGVCGL